MAVGYGRLQRGHAAGCCRNADWIGTDTHQLWDKVCIAVCDGLLKQCQSAGGRHVGIGSGSRECWQDIRPTVLHREPQCAHTFGIGCCGIGPEGNEGGDQIAVACVDGDVQERDAIAIGLVGIGSAGEHGTHESKAAIADGPGEYTLSAWHQAVGLCARGDESLDDGRGPLGHSHA
jgi:hypothetical protein